MTHLDNGRGDAACGSLDVERGETLAAVKCAVCQRILRDRIVREANAVRGAAAARYLMRLVKIRVAEIQRRERSRRYRLKRVLRVRHAERPLHDAIQSHRARSHLVRKRPAKQQ